MSPIRSSAFSSGVAGVKRELEHFDQAAANVLEESTAHHERVDTVQVSQAARNATRDPSAEARDGGEHLGAGLEGAIIDTRMAKYAMVANLKTLQTADEMSQELLRAVDPKSK